MLDVTSREEKLILTVFLETAGRRKEVFRLRVDDINIERQMIRLWTRKTRDGSKEGEWLPISPELSKELSWWLENRPLKESIWLFPNEKTDMPYVDPRKWFARICDAAEVRKLGYHAIVKFHFI